MVKCDASIVCWYTSSVRTAKCRIHKAAKYEIQKTSTCRATLFRCLFLVNVSRFSPRVINLARNKTFVAS